MPVAHQVPVQRGVGANALNHQLVQGLAHPGQGHLPVLAEADDLGDQRVVEGRHGVAVVEVGVHADARPARGVEGGDLARGGQEVLRVFGVDAALEGVAVKLDCPLVKDRGMPAAMRSCSLTISMPVIISVTGCSTCTRVFISMK